MARILAIESDPKRKRLLTSLIREHVKAELTVAGTMEAAVAILERQVPDLIVAPTLLSPREEEDLMAAVRRLDAAPYLQILTIAALDMLADAPKEERRTFGLLKRRQVSQGLRYDPTMVATQIADGLETARIRKAEHEAQIAHREWLVRNPRIALAALAPSHAAAERPLQNDGDERRTARRRAQGDVPWLSEVKLSWGDKVALVNISTSGVLLETGSKLTPGSTTELHLTGPESNMVVPVRFIRSEVARIDGLGVKYHAAAAFAKEIDLAGPRRRGSDVSNPSQALADLLADVLGDVEAPEEPAHSRFARGLRQIVSARDVQVRSRSSATAGGRETLYFDVPGDDRSSTTLQVVFDRNYDVTESQFKLLKAAAWMTAAVMELERPLQAAGGVKLLAERVA